MQSINGFNQQNMTFLPPAYGINIPLNATTAEVLQVDGEVYVSHLVYCVLLFAISVFLLAVSITTIILQQRTLSPDMLGYASSLTRDCRFESGPLPKEGKWIPLDSLERARALKDMRVIIGDIEPESESGYIAFAPTKTGPHRLRKGRLYR